MGRCRLGLGVDVVDGVANSLDVRRVFVGDGESELFLELHDELDGVEGVSAEVVDEGGLHRDVLRLSLHVVTDKLDDALFDSLSFAHN